MPINTDVVTNGPAPGYDAPVPDFLDEAMPNARVSAIVSLDLMVAVWYRLTNRDIKNMAVLLVYCHDKVKAGGKVARRVYKVDVEKLVDDWVEVIVDLSTAHDHAVRTAADKKTSDLLSPILRAPIGQIRKFAELLGTRLKEDKRVPFLIWSCFETITKPIVEDRPAGAAIELRNEIATRIAEVAESRLDRSELVRAMADALQWRPAETLEKVEKEMEKGGRPRLQGRESCLFLQVGDVEVVL